MDDMKRLAMALYKSMPAKLRDEKDIDDMVRDFNAFEAARKKSTQSGATPLDLKSLGAEITQFLEFAYAQYYVAPNTVVRKPERPKWRFKVKNYIKRLQMTAPETEEGKTATELLSKLYAMLSYACGYYLFNTEDPFRSIGMKQQAVLEVVIVRLLADGINAANLSKAILLIVDGYTDRETITMSLILALVHRIRTTDGRETAIAQCKRLWEKKAAAIKPKGRGSDSYFLDYWAKESLNHLVSLVFLFYAELYEFDSGIDYFLSHYKESDAEIHLYALLRHLRLYEQPALWMREFERAKKRNVEPRKTLIDEYDRLKETGEFSASYY